MTMVISLGLERFYYGESEDAWTGGVRALVAEGVTTRAREIVTPRRSALEEARVFEAWRGEDGVSARWLDAAEAEPLIGAVRAVYEKYDTFASFSWDETDRLGIEMPSLALVNDGEKRLAFGSRVNLPGVETPVDAGDLSACWLGSRRHSQLTIARAYVRLAREHRLVVHSA